MKDLLLETILKAWSTVFGLGRSRPPKLPETYKDYRLVKDLNHSATPRHAIGLYEHGRDKVVVKIWTGRHPDQNYYLFKREIKFLEVVNSLRRPEDMVSFPELIESSITKSRLVLVTRFVPGKLLSSQPNFGVISIFQACVEYLSDLSSRIQDPHLCRPKKLSYMLSLYLPLLLIAILRRPYYAGRLIKGLWVFLVNLPALVKATPGVRLVHGDLHPDNILLTDTGRIVLLDPEMVMNTYAPAEYATVISNFKSPSYLKSYSMKQAAQYRRVFKAVGVFFSTFDLASPSRPPNQASHLNLLTVSTQL